MNTAKISIVTTIYKAESDLPRLLDSMMELESTDIEFFLIDNGSPDRCGEICEQYAKKDERFKVCHLKDNIGYIQARNYGIEHCHGQYVGFCDSDDYLERGGYDVALQQVANSDCDFFIGAYCQVDGEDCKKIEPPFEPGIYKNNDIEKQLLPSLFGNLNGRGSLRGFVWKNLYKKSILLKNDIRFSEELKPYEDELFNLCVMKHSICVQVDNQIIYNYVVNSQSITAKLLESFDAFDEWKRVRGLFCSKKKIVSRTEEMEALCNQGLEKIYIIILNMAKQEKVPLRKNAIILKEICQDNVVKEILMFSSPKNNRILDIVKKCLRLKLYMGMLCLVRVGLKIREGRSK